MAEEMSAVATSSTEKAFSAAVRIRCRRDFDYVKTSGRTAVGRFSVVQAAKPARTGRRIAIVISRYYSGKAVVRNRARRLLREAYRSLLPSLDEAWIVLRPRAQLKHQRCPQVLSDLRQSLEKLGLVHEQTPTPGQEHG
jgi:ribonuclease P protein component